MSRKSRLILVRHGQTPANINRVWHGSTDTPLTELGHHQAARLGAHFPNILAADVIYASPLQRARNTAQAIASPLNIDVNLDPRLREFSLGEWEGFRFDDISNHYDPEGRIYKDPDFSAPGGESQRMVKKRVVEAIEDIIAANTGRNIVIVSHGVTLGIALSHYLHRDTTRWMEYSHQNTAYSEFCPQDKKLLYFNRTDHLGGT